MCVAPGVCKLGFVQAQAHKRMVQAQHLLKSPSAVTRFVMGMGCKALAGGNRGGGRWSDGGIAATKFGQTRFLHEFFKRKAAATASAKHIHGQGLGPGHDHHVTTTVKGEVEQLWTEEEARARHVAGGIRQHRR